MRCLFSIFLTLFITVNLQLLGQNVKHPVIIELFTSEGCSSCPMADDMIKEMTQIMQAEGKQIVPLAFHVTYWNHLGWNDRFSKEEFTERQKKYAIALNTSQLYTPQAITNGMYEFVGSNPVKFRESVENALREEPLDIKAKADVHAREITIEYDLNSELKKNVTINAVLIQKSAERKIERGENKNRTLRHYNVVKELITEEPQRKGVLKLIIDEDVSIDNSGVVLFLQHKKTMKILGAIEITNQNYNFQ